MANAPSRHFSRPTSLATYELTKGLPQWLVTAGLVALALSEPRPGKKLCHCVLTWGPLWNLDTDCDKGEKGESFLMVAQWRHNRGEVHGAGRSTDQRMWRRYRWRRGFLWNFSKQPDWHKVAAEHRWCIYINLLNRMAAPWLCLTLGRKAT